MNPHAKQLIDGYLDETLTSDEQIELNFWLKESPENAGEFARAVLLHDRLRNEVLVMGVMLPAIAPSSLQSRVSRSQRWYRQLTTVAGVAVVALVAIIAFWKGVGETPVSAAVAEINRIIRVSDQPTDRTYQITVQKLSLPPRRDKRPSLPDRDRPPKPPMDGAILHVRGGRQFVLERTTVDGHPFVTGSNGLMSWAVRPDGPVRVSSDITRFSHDLPGHEHSMPLISIRDGLERLLEAYDVQLLPIESDDDEANPVDDTGRLIVAVKKPGYRGPKRVEISYSVRSGLIRQIRFVEMPYGPERQTLLLTLVEEQHLGASFFDHEAHHEPGRTVEIEK